jgi:hypothetical protein
MLLSMVPANGSILPSGSNGNLAPQHIRAAPILARKFCQRLRVDWRLPIMPDGAILAAHTHDQADAAARDRLARGYILAMMSGGKTVAVPASPIAYIAVAAITVAMTWRPELGGHG